MFSALERKMRRRIRRQIETGHEQARVRKIDDRTFDYAVTHHSNVVRFVVGKTKVLGKCRLIIESKMKR